MSDSVTAPTTGEREPDVLDVDDEHNLGDLGHLALYTAIERALGNKTGVMLSWQIANAILRGYTKAKQNRDALRADLARVTDQLATAQREAAGLREDAKRIDWLQERFVRIAIDHGDVDVAVFRVPAETFGLLGFNHDLRAMVDCARFPDEAIAQARAGATTFTPTTETPTDA